MVDPGPAPGGTITEIRRIELAFVIGALGVLAGLLGTCGSVFAGGATGCGGADCPAAGGLAARYCTVKVSPGLTPAGTLTSIVSLLEVCARTVAPAEHPAGTLTCMERIGCVDGM
mmetsp:Transcript_11221/g.25198  ORF Transcript_11221/g.25198 Transcript_11221/m.25198 type:complete len:115 (+) Transcript_11221:1529-1873(+)